MPTAYAYIRYSTRRQGDADKDSVSRQMASIQAIVKQHNLDLPEENIFSDTGVSAFSGKNRDKGQLKELIDRIESLHIKEGDYVFVESIDRLSRQRLLQAKELVNGILEKGIVLITTIDGQRYEKPNAKNRIDDLQQDILLSVIAKRAYEESNTKSFRRKSAWKRAKTAAEENNKIFNAKRPPYGIVYNETTEKFEIHEEEAKEIQAIFEALKLKGVTQTIKDINKTSKRRWTQNAVKSFFDTKYPLGYYMSQRKEDGKMVFDKYIENYYPQIISFELWNEAKLAMSKRKVNKEAGRPAAGNMNIFKFAAKCGCCGEPMTFQNNFNKNSRSYYYLNCKANFELAGKCSNRFRFDYALGTFLDLIYQSTTNDYFEVHPWQLTEIEEDMIVPENEREWLVMDGTQDTFEYRIASEEEQKQMQRVESFKTLLIQLMSDKAKNTAEQKEVIDKENELIRSKTRLEGIERSIEESEDGYISKFVMKQLAQLEQEIETLTTELEILKASVNTARTDIKIYSVDDILKLFATEEGRLKINNFFTMHKIAFSFNYDKLLNTVYCKIYKNGQYLDKIAKAINTKDPLGDYGLGNLAEQFLMNGTFSK